MRQRICSLLLGTLAALCAWPAGAAEAPAAAPDFKEVYNLIRTNVEGVNEPELNRAAVDALVSSLSPKVALVDGSTTGAGAAALVSKSSAFEGNIAYLRVARVRNGLSNVLATQCKQVASTNKLIGVVLDLRYAGGHDYAAACDVCDLFLNKEKPLLDWGKGVVRSKANPNAISVPVAVLVNAQTSGAAEALAAVLRQSGVALILGGQTAGQALMGREYPLSNGSRLRIATGPVHLADGSPLSEQGVKPDIAVEVSREAERAYFANAFTDPAGTNLVSTAALSATNQLAATNHTRRIRFNEAELVRERREGLNPELEFSTTGSDDVDKTAVRDPVLARALDVLKGLAVVRQSRS